MGARSSDRSSVVKARRWTEEEVSRLRSLAISGRWATTSRSELLAAFPNRTLQSIRCQADRLRPGTRRGARGWTREDEKLLRELWPSTSERTLRQQLRRSWNAIRKKAETLGIRHLRWQGYESPAAAARRAGYSRDLLRRILGAWNHHYQRFGLEERAELPNPSLRPVRTHFGANAGKKYPRRVETGIVDLAVAWWLGLETLGEACDRLGMHHLPPGGARAAGVRRNDRHSPEEWDRLLLALRRRPGTVAARDSREVAA
jgi:hypothetical protein